MLKKIARINEETKQAEGIILNIDDDRKTAFSLIEADVELAYNGNWYLTGHAPAMPIQMQIEALEEQQTARLYREAIAGGEYAIAKLAEIDAKIAELRKLL